MSSLVAIAFLLLCLGIMTLAVFRPAIGSILALASFGLEQVLVVHLDYFSEHHSAFNILFGLMCLSAYGMMFLRRTGTSSPSASSQAVRFLILGFLFYVIVSHTWTIYSLPWKSLEFLPYFLNLVIIAPLLLRGGDDVLHACVVCCGLFDVACLYTLADPSTWANMATDDVRKRLALQGQSADDYLNPLALADLGAYAAILGAVILKGEQADASPWGRRAAKLIALIGLGSGTLLAFQTSRGEFIALAICLLAALGFYLGKFFRGEFIERVLPAALPVVAIATVIGLYNTFYDTIVTIAPRFSQAELSNAAVEGRWDIQKALLDKWEQSPISIVFGLGARASEELSDMYPHSLVVQGLGEFGLVGLGLILGAYATAFGTCWKRMYPEADTHRSQPVVLLALLVLIYSFVVTNKRGSLVWIEPYMMVLIVAGLLDVADRRSSQTQTPAATVPVPR